MPTRTHLYFNITYRCDSNCIFCAADLGPNASGRQITFKQFVALVGQFPRGRRTLVTINGGEPALHHELIKFLRHLKRRGNPTQLFTNGRKLASPGFAKLVGANLAGTVLIPLYGSRPEVHDAFTRVKGSWVQTVRGISNIYALKARRRQLRLHLKLLFIKPLLKENIAVIKYILRSFPKVDIISLHPLIVSEKVKGRSGLVPSRQELARSVNEVLKTIRDSALKFDACKVNVSDLPPCVVDRENRKFLFSAGRQPAGSWETFYFDPDFLALNQTGVEDELLSSRENDLWSTCNSCRQKNRCHFLRERPVSCR